MRPTAGPGRAARVGQWLPAGEGAELSPGPRTREKTSDPAPPRRWSCRPVLPETLETRAALLGRGRSCDKPGKGRPLRLAPLREGRGRKAQVREPSPRLQEAEETGLM